MPSACGVSWSGTSSGKLDESSIPDDDFASHYLNAGDTKSDSSFPVVDGSGNLRAGNVRSAWKLRGQGEEVSEDCLRQLANSFDETPLPESAYESSADREPVTIEDIEAVGLNPSEFDGAISTTLSPGPDDVFGIATEFQSVPESLLDDGFNEHGVRVNDDGSVDARFNAMEPGVRRGVDITEDFLANLVGNADGKVPVQLDHSKSQRANVGFSDPRNIQFGQDMLQVQVHIPNTGSSIRDDVIADFSHDPPQIHEISVGLDPRTVEVERPQKRGDPVRFVDGKLLELSLTLFPAGYDNGGLTPAFSEAIEGVFVDEDYPEEDCETCPDQFADINSKLTLRPHKLTKKVYEL